MASFLSSVPPSDVGDSAPGPLRVLIVDDDADALAVLGEALTVLGHPFVTAQDGAEAWAHQCREPSQVILSDWSMPNMSGVDLCRLVRANSESEYVYFVLTTAYGDKQHFLEGMRAGADDYLTKPVVIDELEARLLSATRVVSMQRALSRRNAALARQGDITFEAARVDTLTQSANRLRLGEDLDVIEARASRYGHRFCAALCDIDWFKQYNDAHGHLAGDAALRLVASEIRRTLRQADMLYRYGGEEFLVILPEQTLEAALRVMERVRSAVEALSIAHPACEGGVLTISVGVASLTDAGGDRAEWLGRADAALYRAKGSGRNRVDVDLPVPLVTPGGPASSSSEVV